MLLILDWLAREGHILVLWWLWITLAGAAALPLSLALLGGLPDKGYTLARPIGMLLVTTVYWLLGSYGFLENTSGGIALSWFLVLIASIVIYRRSETGTRLAVFWRDSRMQFLAAELLFIALFFAWALYRAHQNDILGTEKPMELAFLSATQRSASFPPADPWMSGYAISYLLSGLCDVIRARPFERRRQHTQLQLDDCIAVCAHRSGGIRRRLQSPAFAGGRADCG